MEKRKISENLNKMLKYENLHDSICDIQCIEYYNIEILEKTSELLELVNKELDKKIYSQY